MLCKYLQTHHRNLKIRYSKYKTLKVLFFPELLCRLESMYYSTLEKQNEMINQSIVYIQTKM